MNNNYYVTGYVVAIWIMVIGIFITLIYQFKQVNNNLTKLYEYGAEADMCWQEVEQLDYYHRTCQVEYDGDAYHWYNRAIEGRE